MWGVPPFHEPDLFTEPEPEEETVVEATRRFFEEAYSGQRPALRYFSVDMARFDGDETSSAAHNEDFRLAAA